MRYILIEEVEIPGVTEPVPQSEEEQSSGKPTATRNLRVHSGTLMIEMLTHPVEKVRNGMGDSETRPMPNDIARMRSVIKPLDYLDEDGDGKCDLPLGSYAELEDAWYDLIWAQAQIYPFRFWSRPLLAMMNRWEKAPAAKPLELTVPDPEPEELAAEPDNVRQLVGAKR